MTTRTKTRTKKTSNSKNKFVELKHKAAVRSKPAKFKWSDGNPFKRQLQSKDIYEMKDLCISEDDGPCKGKVMGSFRVKGNNIDSSKFNTMFLFEINKS